MFFRLTASTLLVTSSLAVAASAAQPARVVPCDQPVKSSKRGVCLNKMDAADFMALSPGVSWWYSWHFTDTNNPPKEANMEFLPMVWGDRPDSLEGLKTYLANHKPRRILAINEPNLKGQAFITPQRTAEVYKEVKAIGDQFGIPVVGPHMALGSATGDSITAMDPIEKKDVTYTYMVPFEKAFLSYMGDTPVTAVAAHSYGNFGELNWLTGMLGKEFQKPVWITEFAQWGAADADAERDYMIQAVDLFERTPNVEGYAWFKDRADNGKIALLDKQSGKLTPLGVAYVNMPVHDPNVYYRLPGRLQSECYLAFSKAEIGLTKDTDGFLEMQPEANSWLDYNVAVEKAGTFKLKIRCKTQPGIQFDILAGDKVLASATTTTSGWQTVETKIDLPAGNQTIRLRTAGYAHLNWMEFSAG